MPAFGAMMKIAYFDCFHGAAGDMLLASLLDAGLELAALEQTIATLPLTGYAIEWQHVTSHHIGGSRLRVRIETPQPTRTWADIRTMLETSNLPQRARAWVLAAFARLARAEAAIHGIAIGAVHFHEVGAVDSIVDMVGFCVGLELLGIEQVYASALPLGGGWVNTQHGLLPTPAPATLALLAEVGAPILPAPTPGELVTPTAAALLAELARFEQPAMRLQRIGYGLGHKEFDRLNGLRVWLGETPSNDSRVSGASQATDSTHRHNHHPHDHHHRDSPGAQQHVLREQVVELRCNLDDVTGELAAYTIEQLLAAGALDAWTTPLVMKKGRPAVQLCCLARPATQEALAQMMLRETPTLGVRWEAMERLIAANLATFKGPRFNPTGLVEAGERLKGYKNQFPAADVDT
ncbi:MAG: nickel pincer cofactor biosynthesis protein LarC, partial [Chloroflexales bacterium]|nr:nickel pincer cofactor biosynthesis protein LarC [Chloroflexales bacterium]